VSVYRRTRAIDPKNPASKRVSYGRLYIRFADHRSIDRRLPGYATKSATVELENKLCRLVEVRRGNQHPEGELATFLQALPPHILRRLVEWDLVDEKRHAAGRTLAELLAEWGESIRAGDVTEKHVELTTGRAGALFRACGFRYWTDIRPEPVEQHLHGLREGDKLAIGKHVAALGAHVPGNVRAYWIAAAEAGVSSATSNHMLQAARAFCLWMVARGIASADPLRVLAPVNARADRRVRRRALTDAELRELVSAAQRGPELGLVPGPARALVYVVAAETGFRLAELQALRVASFADLDGENPTVTLPAANAKNRTESVQPLRLSTARALSRFLAGRGAIEPAFGLPAAWRAPRALRSDLESAGIPFLDVSGRRFDFHALRGMLATRLLSAGASVRTAQSMMRHSTADLTVSVYTRVRAGEEREAVEKLPDLLGAAPEELRSTGTAGAPEWCGPWHRNVAGSRTDPQDLASSTRADGAENATEAPCEGESWWRRRESNPRPGMNALRASTCVSHGLSSSALRPWAGSPRTSLGKFSPVRPEARLAGQPAVYVSGRPRALRPETAD